SELDLGNGSETSVDFSAAGSNEGMASRLKRFGLSDRELDVALLLLNGQKWDEIADTLGISRNTLKSHVRSIYRKTGARNRQELLLQTFAHPADDQR
ncbi:MAG: helix-turn-helix transcriptional regulator, partial [Chloroflexota bacterium]|nr:helix-turn-helix transcriptional regulator [Chloroflexota bacterium]